MSAHAKDSDCDLDPATDVCRGCGVYHGDPCPDCGGRGFHTVCQGLLASLLTPEGPQPMGSAVAPACPHGCPTREEHTHMTYGGVPTTFRPAPLEEWVFTFGFDHIHPQTGDLLSRCYIRIPGAIDESREKMMAIFGRDWSQQYPLEMGLELARKHKLIEIPWGGR